MVVIISKYYHLWGEYYYDSHLLSYSLEVDWHILLGIIIHILFLFLFEVISQLCI